MIRKIHYCWFGSPMPPQVARNVEKWRALNPDFEICQWNEQNIDVSAYEFGRRTLAAKRWGFLVDIIRPQKLFEEGGFYIDADVELIRPLRDLEAEADYLIMGYIYDCALGTAALYSPPGHPVIKAILDEYHAILPDACPASNVVFTEYFINQIPGFLLNGRRWKSETEKISLYPKEFFEQPSFIRRRGMAIHHASGSWITVQDPQAFNAGTHGYVHFIKWLKRKVRVFYSLLIEYNRFVFLRALFRIPSRRISTWKKAESR